jgi:hypothetical protein
MFHYLKRNVRTIIKIAVISLLTGNRLAAQQEVALSSDVKVAPPQTVMATDGTLEKEVQIAWQSLGLNYEYWVVRALSPSLPPQQAVPIGHGWQKNTHLSDRSVEDGKFYYYFVKARRDKTHESHYSAADKGYSLVTASSNITTLQNTSFSILGISSTTCQAKDSFTVSFAVENKTNNALHDMVAKFYLSADEQLDKQDMLLKTNSLASLEARQTARSPIRMTAPNIEGSYYIIMAIGEQYKVFTTQKLLIK